jgi:hypothetical protein
MTVSINPLVLTLLNQSNPIVTSTGTPTPSFTQTINNSFNNLLVTINAVISQGNDTASLLAQIITLNGLVTATNATVDALAKQAALVNSYTSPTSVLTASYDGTSATITIAAHSRIYGDGTSVSVSGGSIAALLSNTVYYVFYTDTAHAGGTVTYHDSLSGGDAAQTNGVHSVGVILTPSTTGGSSGGAGGDPPGVPIRPGGGGAIP